MITGLSFFPLFSLVPLGARDIPSVGEHSADRISIAVAAVSESLTRDRLI